MDITYKNKLVRDKIPEIIVAQDYTCKSHILDDSTYQGELKKKLLEEAKELNSDWNLEEASDVYEVLLAIVNNMGYTLEDLINASDKKRSRKGGFSDKVFLEYYYKNQPEKKPYEL